MFNSATPREVPPGPFGEVAQTVRRFFDERGFPWCWQAYPTCRPADLTEAITASGFALSHETPGMAIDLRNYREPAPPEIEEVRDPRSLDRWAAGAVEAFGLPSDVGEGMVETFSRLGWGNAPSRLFQVVKGDLAVAVSLVFYDSGVAGIYCVGTHPDCRRQGLGEKATRACLSAAVEDGYDVAILHSSKMGLPLYSRIGFKEYCRIGYYS